jgi:DNA-binding HxlR family transcriptional regulator
VLAEVNCLNDEACAAYIRKASLVMEIMRGKWTLQILCAMRTEPVRLGRLRRLIPKASKKGLVGSLRDLESNKIIVRRDLSNTVLHIEYDFADGMRSILCSILDNLAKGGDLLQAERSFFSDGPS